MIDRHDWIQIVIKHWNSPGRSAVLGTVNLSKIRLTRRFSEKEAPIAARRQLMSLQQKESESLEEFSQRVQFLCMNGPRG